ncbi:MAG TPA: hypothetical protein VHY37_04760, partial [Tepidisphaeraceae bacterium]|nr:hypothetical protein [Tepidisphaeraceae bacterium]
MASDGGDYLFRPERDRLVTLSKTERSAIFRLEPQLGSISRALYFDNYDLPCPIRVELIRGDGSRDGVVLRREAQHQVQIEVEVYEALSEFGLPVPRVLARPFETDNGRWCAVYSLLSGQNLQWISSQSTEGLGLAGRLLIDAVRSMRSSTQFVARRG